ncbi:alpha-hydroxy acid oxidase [Orrella sp. JC864]|uniref:alpha-hydroxy acid oxidase n=1 Tax=Orrella sp. JC864 TaxID=3120298 RepID=UPI0012BCEA95
MTATRDAGAGRPELAAYAAATGLPRRLRGLLCLDDFEAAARRHLPRPLFGYIAGAAETNRSYLDNRLQFDDYAFVPHVMADVSRRTTETTLFGRRYRMPFGIAPVGISAISAYRGDIVLAQAAQAAGVPAVMSGTSLIRMEEVAAAAPGTWFQAYLPGDDSKLDGLIARVAQAGFQTLVVTVDLPVWANRENNVRTGFSMPLRPSLRLAWDGLVRPRWLLGTFARTLLRHGMPHFENSFATRGAPMFSVSALRDTTGREHLNWAHIRRIRRQWQGPLVVKGILHPRDAQAALDCGADGIVVSNHGGRQLDGAVAPLRVLPRIVDAVGGRATVMMDGGVRRGADVLKAVALGAACVFAGRPFMYAAAVGGREGVDHALKLLGDEVSRNLAMLGLDSLDALSPDCLQARPR